MYNIEDIVKGGGCIGCGACLSLCPFGALEVEICDLGYPIPLKSPKCNNCGICLSDCPSTQHDDDSDE